MGNSPSIQVKLKTRKNKIRNNKLKFSISFGRDNQVSEPNKRSQVSSDHKSGLYPFSSRVSRVSFSQLFSSSLSPATQQLVGCFSIASYRVIMLSLLFSHFLRIIIYTARHEKPRFEVKVAHNNEAYAWWALELLHCCLIVVVALIDSFIAFHTLMRRNFFFFFFSDFFLNCLCCVATAICTNI